MGTGLSGVLRMTWMQDGLVHVLEHCEADEPSGTWTGLAGPDHGLAMGSDVDNATLSRMCAHGEIADLIWEAPEDLTGEHRQVFEAAMDAYHAGNSKAADLLWQDIRAIWSRAWSATTQPLNSCRTRASPGSRRSSRSAGSWPPSSTTAARTAYRTPTSTTSSSPG
jgi:hypothetical protein